VAIPANIAATVKVSDPPTRREGSPIKLVHFVQSIAAARKQTTELGGHLNSAAREWKFQGVRVCDGHDPEGNVFQLRENPLANSVAECNG
jgi:predicted enzyme related to lactoylglutathione lyase